MQTIRHPLFALDLPPDWQWFPDEHGGSAVPPGPPAALHLSAERVVEAEELPNLSRMLAGFVTRHVGPVTTQDLIPANFPQATGFAWQFIEETAERPPHLWKVWIAGNEHAWCFVSFNCSLKDHETHREKIENVVSTLTLLTAPDADAPPTNPEG